MADEDFVMEERKGFMVPPTGGHECRTAAHFLRPSAASIASAAAPSPDSVSLSADGAWKHRALPLKADFIGWRLPTEEWKKWVEEMSHSHRSTWETAGILDAIMISTIAIDRRIDLICEFLEKWCPSTNTFVFPWGEATVTLEDTAVLGGYSLLGECVLTPPEDGETQEIVKKLDRARAYFYKTKARKVDQGGWLAKFMGSQSEIEHEAFLTYWLSRFVFPHGKNLIGKSMLPIAARLARGCKIALAPAVLAGIYKCLSLVKADVVAARKSRAKEGQDKNGAVKVTVLAPLAIVQVWIWERFPSLKINPKPVGPNEPRLGRWRGLKKLSTGNLSSIINSAGKEFLWRPYTSDDGNIFAGKIYKENGYWATVNSGLDEDLEGLIRCMRASELVGLEADCIQQYLPHRVAMQFGMDQDIPCHVARVNICPQIAWNDYTRPIRDARVYIPSRLASPQCTLRYLKWWKKLHQALEPALDGTIVEEMKGFGGIKLEDNDLRPLPGLSPKRKSVVASEKLETFVASGKENSIHEGIMLEDDDLPPPPGFSPKRQSVVASGKSENSIQEGIELEDDGLPPPPGCSPKRKSVSAPEKSETFVASGKSESSIQEGIKLEDDGLPPPPGFSPNRKSTVVVSEKSGTFVASGKSENSIQERSKASSIAQEVSPRRSPLSSTTGSVAKLSRSWKKKFQDSAYRKITNYYATASPPCSTPKRSRTKGSCSGTTETNEPAVEQSSSESNQNNKCHENEGKGNLSSTADNVKIDDAVECTDSGHKKGKAALRVRDGSAMEEVNASPCRVQSSTSEARALPQIEERIKNVEKVCAWLMSLPVVKNQACNVTNHSTTQ